MDKETDVHDWKRFQIRGRGARLHPSPAPKWHLRQGRMSGGTSADEPCASVLANTAFLTIEALLFEALELMVPIILAFMLWMSAVGSPSINQG